MLRYLGISYVGSVAALGVASCCVLPITLMLLGGGGSSLAVFGKVAAASYYVLPASTALVFASWIISQRRNTIMRLKWWLGGTTLLTALAWTVVLNEVRINDYLIMLM
jgi:mercuric ion transport protein